MADWNAAIAAATRALSVHRWRTMGATSVQCECGTICDGNNLNAFPADEAFRAHLAGAILAAAHPHLASLEADKMAALMSIARDWQTLSEGDQHVEPFRNGVRYALIDLSVILSFNLPIESTE